LSLCNQSNLANLSRPVCRGNELVTILLIHFDMIEMNTMLKKVERDTS